MTSISKKNEIFRKRTADLMTCKECGARMLIVDTYRVCENGCGKLLHGGDVYAKAWPERVVRSRSIGEMAAAVDGTKPAKNSQEGT